MRTISADNDAILRGGARQIGYRLQVRDAGGTMRDLTTYPGVDLVEDVGWSEDLDSPGITWEATLTREQASISLAPLMQASPLNRAFDPANPYAALLQVGREIRVDYAMQAEDDPRPKTYVNAFRGYIDVVDSGGSDNVKLSGRGLEARIMNAFIKRERVYAFAQGANADRGCYIWTPNTVWASGDRLIPTDSKRNGHFYRVTTGGTGGATEPTWPTGGASTVADGGATFTESGATSTSVGTPVETVMQQILDDNLGAGVVTLWCPVSPGWDVQWFLVARQSTFDELKLLADQIGWFFRYMDNAGTPALKFFDPLRTTTTSLRSFYPTEVDDYKRLSTDWKGIRNVIRVVYSDSQDLDPAGNPKRKSIEVSDSASITKYSELFAEIAEASNSNIDSASEATVLATGVLSDLSEPEADMEVPLLSFFAFVELADLYTFTADGVHFDGDQKLAVVSYSHRLSASDQSTTIRVRGKPASNGKKGWFERMSDSIGTEQHQLTAAENTSPITLVADASPVGGARFDFGWDSAKAPKDVSFELHLSTSTGFTPSAATLVATGKERSREVGNLDSSQTYFARVVPVTWNAQKPIRGSPTEEVSFRPGVAIAGQVSQDVNWGRLPLNGGFETQFASALPPDWWEVRPSFVWGTNLYLQSDADGKSGGTYLVAKTLSSIDSGGLYSAFFPVEAGEPYTITLWKKCVGGSGNNLFLTAHFRDYAKVFISNSDTVLSLADDVGTWVKIQINGTAPANAKFGRVGFALAPGASGREVHLDSVVFEQPRADDIEIGGSLTQHGAVFLNDASDIHRLQQWKPASGSDKDIALIVESASGSDSPRFGFGIQKSGASWFANANGSYLFSYRQGTASALPLYIGAFDTAVVAGSQYIDPATASIICEPNTGKVSVPRSLAVDLGDSSASPGDATLNFSAGQSAIALGASAAVITSDKCDATSIVHITPLDLDATLVRWKVAATGGSFTVTGNAAATAPWRFNWQIFRKAN
jgi:hypothetical protein